MLAIIVIHRFGPLSRHWTMRYEARHSYFKKLAQNIGNFINLPWTLAMRHQLLQCYYHAEKEVSILFENPEIGPGLPCFNCSIDTVLHFTTYMHIFF